MDTPVSSEVLTPVPQPQLNKVLLTVGEACAALSIKRTLLYCFLSTGELRSIKLSGRRLIPVRALDEFVEHLNDLQKAGERYAG